MTMKPMGLLNELIVHSVISFAEFALLMQKHPLLMCLQKQHLEKIFTKGRKLASAYELLYGHAPRVLNGYQANRPTVTIAQHSSHVAQQRMKNMLRSNIRTVPGIKPGDYVYFSGTIRDGSDQLVLIKKKSYEQAESESEEESESAGMPGCPWIPRSRKCDNSSKNYSTDTHYTYFAHSAERYTSHLTDMLSARSIDDYEKSIAYAIELKNWKNNNAMKVVQRDTISKDENIIGSHVVYVRKDNGKTKARIVPWGHKDREKDFLRTDAPCMNMEVFRLVLSIAVELKWTISEMDVTAAFLQAKGFDRNVYVRPPTEEKSANVDNYIYTGTIVKCKNLRVFLHSEFEVGELEHRSFTVFGCEVNQESDGSITVEQRRKIEELNEVILNSTNVKKREPDSFASPTEITNYKSCLGKMLFIGRMTQPIMLRIASHMATKVNKLMRHHLKDLKSLIKYCKSSTPHISFKPVHQEGGFYLGYLLRRKYGWQSRKCARGGYIIMRHHGDVVHPIYWSSRKLRRVARSSTTAEILAAADAIDMTMYLQALLSEVSYSHPFELSTDSRSLFNLATSTKEPSESMNKADLASMRLAFENGTMRACNWTPGYYLAADGLTKDNRESSSLLLKIFREGLYPKHPDNLQRFSPKRGV
eukprot:IDg4588t1